MRKTLPISEVKTHLPELMDVIEARDEPLVVTRRGKPAAVILSYDEYTRLQDTLEVLSDPAMMQQIHRSLKYFAKGGKGKSFEQVFGEPLHPSER